MSRQRSVIQTNRLDRTPEERRHGKELRESGVARSIGAVHVIYAETGRGVS